MLRRTARILVALGASALALSGCASKRDVLVAPNVIRSPYVETRGELLIAVAPPLNESGVSAIDVLAIGDELVAAVSEAEGLSGIPMNRTLAAMSARKLAGIRSPEDAKALAGALGVDGVIVPSITAYDPYDPPTIGLSLALFVQDTQLTPHVDPKALAASYTDQQPGGPTTFKERPAAAVVEHLDAANHQVLMSLKEYAKGRHDPKSALTWRRYTASMELYTEFAAYHTVRRLLEAEQTRQGELAAASTEGKETR
jgi:hypothetical protein